MMVSNVGHVFHRKPGSSPPTITRGKGLRLWTEDGCEYLDAVSGGAAVSCLGHGNEEVENSIKKQLEKVSFYHTSFFTSEPAERLADSLIEHAPSGLTRVLFCSGGSEAVEAALKLTRQYWIELGEPSRSKIISRRQSYHGATLGALSVSGNFKRREIYEPLLFNAHFISPCYEYRHRLKGEDIESYSDRAALELEAAILELGPENVAAFICEPVVGATLGAVPAVPGYLKRIRSICDRYGVLLILDEIMCGVSRTGWRFACEEDGISADLITIAKGLGGGFQPLGAVLLSGRLESALVDGSGELKHGFTYMAHPIACAAGLAVQRYVEDHQLTAAARVRGNELKMALMETFQEHPYIGDIRGRGLFLGLEFVADRESNVPFNPALSVHAKIKKAAMERGLLIYPSSGCVDGTRGDHVLLSPALTISSDEIVEIVDRLRLALSDVPLVQYAKV